MKIEELITELREIKLKYGDVEVNVLSRDDLEEPEFKVKYFSNENYVIIGDLA